MTSRHNDGPDAAGTGGGTTVTLSDADRAETIDRLYDVALDPERFEALLDHWESTVAPLRAHVDLSAPRLLDDPQIAAHFRRATAFLDRAAIGEAGTGKDGLDAMLAPFERVAALVLDRGGAVRAANPAARRLMGIAERATIRDLPLHGDDRPALAAALSMLFADLGKDTAMLRLRGNGPGHLMVLRLQRCTASDGTDLVLAASNGLHLPEGFCDILRQAFDLTRAEGDILCHLVDCRSIAEIAAGRGRSPDTIRAQIKSILAKTETHSQLELVRLALSMIDMTTATVTSPPARQGVTCAHPDHEVSADRTLVAPDGRRVAWMVLGDMAGRPLLYLPMDFGLVRWPASAEAEARARGLRVIVPLRPGYGSSDMVAHGADYDAALLEDTERVLRAEGVRRCPVLSLGDDLYYAVQLARRDPARITGILACAGMLPLTRRAQFERMDKWHRFILAGAKYTPHLLPFMVKAGFLLARRIGKSGFTRAIYGESGADIATFENPEVSEAILDGSEVALSATHSAHEAFARQLVGGQLEDWSGDLVALKGALPVILMNGAQDPQVPRATYEEFRRDHPWIEYHLFEDAGQLVFFRHWRAALDRLAPLVAEADAK
ncbi:helix-turn-helix transcriptional regulator [Roseovarius nitratireducens]|uniref:helix-turn-helix transcriptional regulator n=1 Tax=Roseovarius nitratireducens TaxID=2044597 RepID=UPI000CE1B0C5|nr:helix-turn-helix transcriptional regulator [Roseovarius nitratireducens]